MGPKGIYVYGGTSYDWHVWKHAVRASVLRKYAKRALGLIDGPDSAFLARSRSRRDDPRQLWYVVPDGGDNATKYGVDRCASDRKERRVCAMTHLIKAENVKAFCLDKLNMQEKKPEIVEIEKIIEKVIEREVPLALSFEERDILETALQREQHVTNELLRRAYERDEVHEIRQMAGRIEAIKALMERFGISLDTWANGPAWLVDVDFLHVEDEQLGEVIDPQPTLFEGGL